MGGHTVPKDKIMSRYKKALDLIPELIDVCDILHIYDNTNVPFRIFKKRKNIYYHWQNKYWSFSDIERIIGINEYDN
jgi:predicted ABC-type ATPase